MDSDRVVTKLCIEKIRGVNQLLWLIVEWTLRPQTPHMYTLNSMRRSDGFAVEFSVYGISPEQLVTAPSLRYQQTHVSCHSMSSSFCWLSYLFDRFLPSHARRILRCVVVRSRQWSASECMWTFLISFISLAFVSSIFSYFIHGLIW